MANVGKPVCKLPQQRLVLIGYLDRIGEGLYILDVLVDHLVSKLAQLQPLFGRVEPAKAFGFIQVDQLGSGWLSQGYQYRRKELITQGILQTAESANKSFHLEGKSGIVV